MPGYTPSLEDHQIWLENPVTQWVLRALQTAAEAQRQEWINQTWGPDLSGEPGQCNPLQLVELKTRADAYSAMKEASYDMLVELNGDDPKSK